MRTYGTKDKIAWVVFLSYMTFLAGFVLYFTFLDTLLGDNLKNIDQYGGRSGMYVDTVRE